MTESMPGTPPVYSPDGRFVWLHGAWTPVDAWGPPPAAPYVPQQPTGPGPAYYPQPVAPLAPKSSAVAILLSFFWPGAGHLYVGPDFPGGSQDKAIAFMIVSLVCFLLSLTVIGLVLSIPVGLGCAIYTMIDSNRRVQMWNAAHGFPTHS